ncbi:MAG: hypothetical protein EBU51_01100, partial [Synechococcaceae bacterium WB6_3A_227]|nr:hypothetical protein [Synechococcaceae bacterium WB6_3A_227]
MNNNSALLLPYHRPEELIGLRLAIAAVRKNKYLYLRYQLEGPLEELLIPECKPLGIRNNNLWQHTCFEAFWAEVNSTTYWELNYSVNSDWNIYKFSNYRSNQVEEQYIPNFKPIHRQSKNSLSIGLTIELPACIAADTNLQFGFAAVLEQ